ncbi:HlyD family type I secretion periplasmic adaptor subunit [Belnapia rosea]|uniref:Membrane fusion protein (MFP) family protein n=1 Tax=Belnapia rosea TaxID=938405 RepID=A0A1G7E8C5_9PROT|nr:HlyD family type I secretion periplasmic adaptor subunit [Belnapia rosea]SDE59978.1 type I secretion membrane fusion protein, HlyD family [Belnapia rosea]
MTAPAPAQAPWLRLRDIGMTPGAVATVLLLSLCGQIGYFGFLLILKALMDAMRASQNIDTYLGLIGVFVVTTILGDIYLFHRSTMLRVAADRFSMRLRAEALQGSIRNAVRVDVASGVTVLQDISVVQRFVTGPDLVGALDLIGAVLALAALFYIDSGFGWITVCGILAVIALAFVMKAATARPSALASQKLNQASSELTAEFSHADTMRGLGQLAASVFRWHRRYEAALDASDASHTRKHAIHEIEHLVTGAFVLALMVHGVVLVFEGTGTMGLVLCAFFGGYKAIAPFSGFVKFSDSWRTGLQAWGRLRTVLRQDGAPPAQPTVADAQAGLVLENLGFWPEGRATPVLQDIGLRLPPGSITMVQGRNGAGKSTLLRLVLGLLKPTSGHVLLHGQDTYFCDRERFGARIGYIPQDIQLLDASVRENIGRGPDAGLDDVVAAARAAGIHEMIGRLPQGYRTPCSRLSASQQRLIALARALYGAPGLLVLDEPEANLDGNFRRLLLAAVERVRLTGGIVLVVTHEPNEWAEAAHHALQLSPAGAWSLLELQPLEPVAAQPVPGPQRLALAVPARRTIRQLLDASVPGPPVSKVMRTALLTLSLTLVPFIGWATMTRMEQAVLASGQLVPEGRRKTVNLLEAGILHRLLVQEGSVVQAGQPLLQLDITQAEAEARHYRAVYWGGLAKLARLSAEQAEQRQLAFPAELQAEAAADPAIAIFLQAEQALFAARWAAFDGQTSVQERTIAQLQEQVAGARAQREGAGRQLMAVREQIAGYSRLLTQGYASRFTVLNLQQQEAGFVATIGQANAQEAQLREGIIQAQRQLEGLRLTRLSEIANDLQATEATTAAALQQLRSAQDILTRREVLAPEAGKVTNIQAFTPGASIQAGQPILDLVPAEDRLIVELQVLPTDIDQVGLGQRARIKLTSFRQNAPPLLPGHVIAIAPDVNTTGAGQPVYLVRVAFDSGALGLMPQHSVAAGMPAEAFLLGESRTPLGYFWEPVRGSARRPISPPMPKTSAE